VVPPLYAVAVGMASHRPVIGSKWRAEAARSTSVQILAALLALSASLLPASATAADSNGFVGEAELTKVRGMCI
jgi:hypothetical protein